MVLFQIKGGLGNQMFCYAAARSFEVVTGKTVRYDYESPYRYVQGYFSLDCFAAEIPFANRFELWKRKPKVKVERVLYELLGWNTRKYLVNERKEFSYDPEMYAIQDGAYVTGFWQAEQYSMRIEQVIRKDFQFREPAKEVNLEVLERIKSVNAVSIHVRRADYVSVAATNSLHGVCSLEYYQSAIDYMDSNLDNPFYFVFSDDLSWCRENLNLGNRAFLVAGNSGRKDFEDLRLMSNCKHHIIANSSFSWWGAWLNPLTSKIVIAPRQWMTNPAIDTTDLIPGSWHRM